MPERRISTQLDMGRNTFFLYQSNSLHNKKQLTGQPQLLVCDDDVQALATRVSTDGITPTKAGSFNRIEDLSIFTLSGVPGVPEGAIDKAQVDVLVVGDNFGAGSARIHAVLAMMGSGIKAVVVVGNKGNVGKAERIFEENALLAGGPLVVGIEGDADCINRLLGEMRETNTLTVEEPYNDPIRPLIRKNGGLLAFTKKRIDGMLELPVIDHESSELAHPRTAVEKIIAQHARNINPDVPIVKAGDMAIMEADRLLSYELHTLLMEQDLKRYFGDDYHRLIKNRDKILLFEDHTVFARNRYGRLIDSQREIANRLGLKVFNGGGELTQGSEGVCHTLVREKALILPGQVIIGTDSHTCSSGVLGAFSIGVGAVTMEAALITNDMLVEVPKTVRVNFTGKLPKGSTAKDAMLKLLSSSYFKEGQCIDKIIEYGGPGLASWQVDELFVLTNMSVEGGATSGIVPVPNDAVIKHLTETTGKSKDEISAMYVQSDNGAQFAHKIDIDLSQVEPMVATPGNPTNGTPISRLGKVKITKGYIGSCTGGNISDIQSVADILKARKVQVPLVVQPASLSIYQEAEEKGLLSIIRDAGAQVIEPGCGACIGLGPGAVEEENDVILSDTNRNWPNRMGSGGSIYLAGPLVTAASCISGQITNPNLLQ